MSSQTSTILAIGAAVAFLVVGLFAITQIVVLPAPAIGGEIPTRPVRDTHAPISYTSTAVNPALQPAEIEGLYAILGAERETWGLYQFVMENYDGIYPFTQVARAEKQHIQSIEELLSVYQLPVPPAPVPQRPEIFSLREACRAAVLAERADIEKYDQFLTQTTRPDLQQLVGVLKISSINSHLPAFEACQ